MKQSRPPRDREYRRERPSSLKNLWSTLSIPENVEVLIRFFSSFSKPTPKRAVSKKTAATTRVSCVYVCLRCVVGVTMYSFHSVGPKVRPVRKERPTLQRLSL